MTYIGIDISKDTFVVAYSPDKNSKTKTCNCSVNPVIADSKKLCTFAARPIAH